MIALEDLTLSYESGGNQLPVIRNLSAQIDFGESASIMGRSGSGKSTLLNLMGLMLKPSSGQIVLDGVATNTLTASKCAKLRSKKIGMVFQDFHLLPHLTAEENVSLPLIYASASRREASGRAQELLSLVGLSDRALHKPAELSGGQKQRVAIARSLANRPQLLLADEPTGALDAATGHRIIELLMRLSQEKNTTIILVTHDADIAGETVRQFELARVDDDSECGFKTYLKER